MKNQFLHFFLTNPEVQRKVIYPRMLANADNMRSVFIPHDPQQLVLEDLSRNKVLVAGRRWGKTLTAATIASTCILAGEFSKGEEPTRGWVVSKHYELADKVTRLIYRSLVIKSRFATVACNNLGKNAHIEFKYGSIVEAKSAENPDSLIGEGLDWIVFDEAASCKSVIWEQFLRPTLTDREGIAIFISTPRGYNWFYDLFKRGQSEEFQTWQSWRSPSWDNPYLPMTEIEQAKAELSQMVFEQEYGASFQSNVGAVYPDFDILSHGVSKPEIDPTWQHFRAIDFGYENPFVCLWITVDPLDRVIVYDEYYRSHVSVEQACIDIMQKEQEHSQWWQIPDNKGGNAIDYEFTVCDPSAASARATMLEKGIVTSKAKTDIVGGIELVRQALKYRDDGLTGLAVDIDRCPNTIKESQLYSYPELITSINSREAPTKENDHAMDCLRYFMSLWKRGFIRELEAIY